MESVTVNCNYGGEKRIVILFPKASNRSNENSDFKLKDETRDFYTSEENDLIFFGSNLGCQAYNHDKNCVL